MAIADFSLALELAPECADIRNGFAWLLLTGADCIRDVERARELALRAAAQEPANWRYAKTLGVAFYRCGELALAIERLSAAVHAAGDTGTAVDWFFLAMCYHRRGEIAQARDCYDRGVRWQRDQENLEPASLAELDALRREADAVLAQPASGPTIGE